MEGRIRHNLAGKRTNFSARTVISPDPMIKLNEVGIPYIVAMKLTVPQWVTLGSLIEKEAAKESDRPLIASVLMNRLKINQPLQVDATIQFLLGTPKPKLYNKDLQIPSLYNTYLHRGLPLGPIANPGNASLQAVLHPAQTDFLYYVAKKDGYHAFAKTYAEHLKNVKLYQ